MNLNDIFITNCFNYLNNWAIADSVKAKTIMTVKFYICKNEVLYLNFYYGLYFSHKVLDKLA